MLQNYLACGTNASEAVDFFALNAYEWCGQSSYRLSGYDRLTADVTAYSIPIFFSETGCNVPEPRSFDDQAAIFGPDMSPFWSGAIVYEWIAETNKYGLVSYGAPVDAAAAGAPPDGFQRSGTPTPVQPDFSNLSARWKAAAPSALRVADYSPSAAPPPCPAATPAGWLVNGAVALPTLGQTFDAAARSAITAGTAATGTPAPAGSASKGQGSAAAAPARALLAVAPAAFTVVVLGLVL